jgi:hypothetical protein
MAGTAQHKGVSEIFMHCHSMHIAQHRLTSAKRHVLSFVQVPTYQQLYKTLTEALLEYNETFAVMDLVLFEDAMK